MKKRYFVIALAILMALTAFAACAPAPAAPAATSSEPAAAPAAPAAPAAEPAASAGSEVTAENPINWKFSLAISDTNFQAQAWKKWADRITEETGGRLTFTFYYDDTLLDYSNAYEQLCAGICDIADVHRFASSGFRISENWKAITAGCPVGHEAELSYFLWDKFEEFRNEYKDVHVAAQSFNGGTVYQILSVNKPITCAADMKGMQIWCEADYNQFVLGCGATPINAPFAEVYSSLQKNLFDGMMIPTETLQSCNFAEVCKFITKVNIAYGTAPGHLINLDSWNALPVDIQQIITENAGFVEKANAEGFQEIEKGALQWAIDNHGTTEVIPDAAAQAEFMQILHDANLITAKKLDDQGLPGTEFVNAVAEFAAQYGN